MEFILQRRRPPSLDETCAAPYGPVLGRIRRRTLVCYGLCSFAGLVPWLLSLCTTLRPPPALVAAGCGFLVPGGGMLATGHPAMIVVGLAVMALFFSAGFKLMDMFGNLVFPLMIWLAGGLGGLCAAGDTPLWSPLVSIGAALLVWAYWAWRVQRLLRGLRLSRKTRLDTLPAMLEKLDSVCSAGSEEEERELSSEALTASRYLFDLCLLGKGLENFDKLFFPSLAAYRYQFAYAGYALMTLQCKYTPNFHGYLSASQRFLIESYTLPEACAYWKWEALGGYLRWSPDPAQWGNVMFSGWAAALIAGYGANTGDRRYEEPGALRFKPFYRSDKTWNHSTGSIIESFETQIQKEPAALISCEPNLQFPICNAYAILGMLAYDRAHGTDHTRRIYDKFIGALSSEFCELSGDMAVRRNQLTGLRFTPPTALLGGSFGNIAMAQAYHPIYPGLARRSYAIVRDEILCIKDGLAFMRDLPWEKIVDMGTGARNPGNLISLLELLSLEFGDYEMASALRKTEERYLTLSTRRFKYKDVSVCGMSNLAAARWMKKNDWFDTILYGPPAGAFTGPLLAVNSYPGVLVAKARSSGKDLRLVLYNGNGSGGNGEEPEQVLDLERLEKNAVYTIKETGERFVSDSRGRCSLHRKINGRTSLTILPLSE